MQNTFVPTTRGEKALYTLAESHFPNPISPQLVSEIQEITHLFNGSLDAIYATFEDLTYSGALEPTGEGTWRLSGQWDPTTAPDHIEANDLTYPIYPDTAALFSDITHMGESWTFTLVAGQSHFEALVERINDEAKQLWSQGDSSLAFYNGPPRFRLSGSKRSAWSKDFDGDCGLILVDHHSLTRINSWEPTGFMVIPPMTSDNLRECADHYAAKARPKAAAPTIITSVPTHVQDQEPASPQPPIIMAPQREEGIPAVPGIPIDAFPKLAPNLALAPEKVQTYMAEVPYRTMVGEVARAYHVTFDCKDPEAQPHAGFCNGCAQEAEVAIRAAIPAIEAYYQGNLG